MMNKHILFIFLCLFVSLNLCAQTDTVQWTKGGSVAFSFSNVGLSNWAGGGQSSLSLGIMLDAKATRTTKKSQWESAFNLALGMARVGDRNNLFKKTDDLLVASSKYGMFLKNPKWQIVASAELRSQMMGGYEYVRTQAGKEQRAKTISSLFAPAYIRLELGAEYKTKYIAARLSPLGSRTTLVLNDSLAAVGAFGVTPNQKVRLDAGATFNLAIALDVLENVNFKSNLNLFSPYNTPTQMVVAWDTFLNMKINQYMNAGFSTNLFYDHNVLLLQSDGSQKQAVQFKHVITLNVGFKF